MRLPRLGGAWLSALVSSHRRRGVSGPITAVSLPPSHYHRQTEAEARPENPATP
jgi:hypothetical protein